MTEQVVTSVKPELAIFVKERQPTSVEEVAELIQVDTEAHTGNKEFNKRDSPSKGPRPTTETSKCTSLSEQTMCKCSICCSAKHVKKDCPRTRQTVGAVQTKANKSVEEDDRHEPPRISL